MIKVQEIYDATSGGMDVLRHFYPDIDPNNPKKPLKLRPDDKRPSAGLFCKDNIWRIKDFGGTDNKAYTAVQLVEEKMNLGFREAIDWMAQTFAPHLLSGQTKNNTIAFKPVMSKVAPVSEMSLIPRKSGKFTDAELSCLGYKIKQKTCDEFSLKPLDGYITKAKGDCSWKIESSDTYPIMFYDYDSWGKIYQPYGDLRFMYYGEKPKDFLFGTKTFMAVWEKALKGSYPNNPGKSKKGKSDDYTEEDDEYRDERFEDLIICSGPSDALNVYSAGYQVCWPNSESEPISNDTIYRLKKCCKKLYVLYDADATGLRNAYKLALQDLDIHIIKLPSDLADYKTNKRDSNGNPKPCKDIKDYMMYYKHGQINPWYEFKNRLVRLAKPLKFWQATESEDGKVKYEISNACLFQFLSAVGFYKMPTLGKVAYRYVFVKDKVIDVIDETEIVGRVRAFLINFLYENPEYYTIALENMILRSKQFPADSFQNLESIHPNFKAFTATSEYFFFRNGIVKVTADAIEKLSPDECEYYVIKSKVIQHDITLKDNHFYTLSYSDAYHRTVQRVTDQYAPLPPDNNVLKQEIDKLPPSERFYVNFSNEPNDYLSFLYNTGNKFWREEIELEKHGSQLSPAQRSVVNTNFINKCSTLGYMLSKYKSPGNSRAVYCMETSVTEDEEGQHNGGTGKSLFLDSLKFMRNRAFIDGQMMNKNKMDFIFQRVDFDTDVVHIDDLNSKIDLNSFLPAITNDLTVNSKNKDEFVIPCADAPKFCFTSNHAIGRFDGSLQRRIQFCAFSDYYHAENKSKGLTEWSPLKEFGHNLLFNADYDEMNSFYNFMLQNVQTYLKFGLVKTDMIDIERRQKENQIGIDFMQWADDYFDGKFNKVIDKELAFAEYKSSLSHYGSGFVKKNTFTKKVIGWSELRGYEYNPEWYMAKLSDTERKRNEIRFTNDMMQQAYGFYIARQEPTP